ncbi:DNA-binding transcriptional regulator, AcrR family [Nocardioides exalbidus]|uniref:DNA-binding transcriptional regulator, AcrR family n=1 Tax=Nocardioides exalbidus TaxID=402596 RepID=A0A1H4VIK4_9ACTN|nr:TetR/AcrR family transcriptional regulator [Nocardioides exalbidus]SEC80184.1 DNA-binding transcriptional regulator, AcrR family [Nocardioides exalbidus]
MVENSREQRKSQTREALSQAAIEILATEGIDALTAERIADAAGVSRRTLFNYFPRVEDVLTATIEAVTTETLDAIAARPEGESLRVSALTVLEGLIDSPAFAQARVLERAAVHSTAARRLVLEFDDRQRQALEEGLRRRLGPDIDPIYATSLAAAAFGVLCSVTRLAVEAAGDDDVRAAELHRAWTRQGFEHLFAGFDEAAARPTSTPSTPASRRDS